MNIPAPHHRLPLGEWSDVFASGFDIARLTRAMTEVRNALDEAAMQAGPRVSSDASKMLGLIEDNAPDFDALAQEDL